ncbi:MAG: hypothetical protein JRN46_02485 [Nitrososphaerota archaeon]|nr:hypothetical protein [Nitrososphaerota archaeon]
MPVKCLSDDVGPETGDAYARMTVHGPSGSATVDAVVETGATSAKTSRRTARRSGFSGRRQLEVVLANGENVIRELGSIELEIGSQMDVVPVTVGEEGEAEPVGCTAFEILGFEVNHITRKLEPSLPIEY